MTLEAIAVQPFHQPSAVSWDAGTPPTTLVVAWQHPTTRLIAPVGLLEHDDLRGYRFRYLRRAAEVGGFQPFLGLPDLERTYLSSRLFPVLSQRVMSRKRPDFSRYMRQLHLGDDAPEWEQIGRSEGRRTGDNLHVIPVPSVRPDGATTCRFFVHGIRHVTGGDLPALRGGELLTLQPDPVNEFNSDALLVCTVGGVAMGYVPDLLLEHVHIVGSHGRAELVVEHLNTSEVPVQLRLLVRLEGRVPPRLSADDGRDLGDVRRVETARLPGWAGRGRPPRAVFHRETHGTSSTRRAGSGSRGCGAPRPFECGKLIQAGWTSSSTRWRDRRCEPASRGRRSRWRRRRRARGRSPA